MDRQHLRIVLLGCLKLQKLMICLIYIYIVTLNLHHIYIIYHISSLSANCHCWGYRRKPPFFDALPPDDFRDGMYQLGRQGRWRSWNETSGSTSRFMNRRSPAGVRGLVRELRHGEKIGLRWDIKMVVIKHKKPWFFVQMWNSWNGSTWELSRHRSKTWSMSTRRRNDRWTTPGTTTFRKSSWTEGLGTMAEESWNMLKLEQILSINIRHRVFWFTPRKAICLRDLHWQIATANPTVSEARDALGAASPDEQGCWPTSWDHSDCKPHLCRHWRWIFFSFKCSKTCSKTKFCCIFPSFCASHA